MVRIRAKGQFSQLTLWPSSQWMIRMDGMGVVSCLPDQQSSLVSNPKVTFWEKYTNWKRITGAYWHFKSTREIAQKLTLYHREKLLRWRSMNCVKHESCFVTFFSPPTGWAWSKSDYIYLTWWPFLLLS